MMQVIDSIGKKPATTGVLFVCMGNICRSPTAEVVLREKLWRVGLATHVLVDSAGTHSYHVGAPPDGRAIEHAERRGYDLSNLRARRVSAADFTRFDLILAMDELNLAELRRRCPPAEQHRLGLLLTYGAGKYGAGVGVSEVPDPYYGGREGFEQVLDLVELACDRLVRQLVERATGPMSVEAGSR